MRRVFLALIILFGLGHGASAFQNAATTDHVSIDLLQAASKIEKQAAQDLAHQIKQLDRYIAISDGQTADADLKFKVAQGGMGPGPGTPHSAGGGSVTFTATDNPASQNHGFGTGTATYTNANIGTAAADRIVVIEAGGRTGNTSGDTLSSVTIGGNPATLAVRSTSGNNLIIEQWYLLVTTGTTATIAFTLSGGDVWDRSFLTVGTVTGSTGTPSTTASKPMGFTGDPNVTTSALTIATGGVGVVGLIADGANATPTYNVGTRDYATVNTDTLTMGHITATGSQTPSISGFGGNNTGMVASSWGP